VLEADHGGGNATRDRMFAAAKGWLKNLLPDRD